MTTVYVGYLLCSLSISFSQKSSNRDMCPQWSIGFQYTSIFKRVLYKCSCNASHLFENEFVGDDTADALNPYVPHNPQDHLVNKAERKPVCATA